MLKPVPQAQFFERTRCINCNSGNLAELSTGKFTDSPLVDFMCEDPGGKEVLPHFQNAHWSFVRCGDCGQAFQRRLLTDEWNEKRWNEWGSEAAILEFEAIHNAGTPPHERKYKTARDYATHALRLEKLTRSIRGRDPVRLLDFGCGWAGFLTMCQQFGFDAVGVDHAAARIEGALVKVFPSVAAMGERPPFHVLTLFEVLEHLNEPSAMLADLSKLLMPGGILVLETPDCEGVTGIHTRRDYLKINPLDHINAFTHKTLRSIAERQGFKMIARGSAHVTAERLRVVKREAKHLLGRDGLSTQLYFRKL